MKFKKKIMESLLRNYEILIKLILLDSTF